MCTHTGTKDLTKINDLVSLKISTNLVGSEMAGCVGGFDAHAANVVSAIFIATQQVWMAPTVSVVHM